MSTIAPPQPMSRPAPLASPAVYRFTVDEYERMVLDDDRVELIDGYVVKKRGKNPPHSWTTRELLDRLAPLLLPGWTWRQGQPVRIPKHDEPEPDLAIVRGTNADYKDRHPGPADVALIIEVSESTYDRDRGEKWIAYAKGLIPIYWIVNLAQGRVEVYTKPGPGGYRARQDFKPGQRIPVVLGGRRLGQVAVDDILP